MTDSHGGSGKISGFGNAEEKQERAAQVYEKTRTLANGNAFAQALSGVVGAGVPLLIDAGAIPFYAGLWTDIRGIYGKGEITFQAAKEYLKPNLGFLVQDLVWDKLVGQVPIVGIPFNYAFGKALTWRLGAWFGMLSALGEESDGGRAISQATMNLVREIFPSEGSVFTFKAPEREIFISFVSSVDGLSNAEVKRRADAAMKALRGE